MYYNWDKFTFVGFHTCPTPPLTPQTMLDAPCLYPEYNRVCNIVWGGGGRTASNFREEFFRYKVVNFVCVDVRVEYLESHVLIVFCSGIIFSMPPLENAFGCTAMFFSFFFINPAAAAHSRLVLYLIDELTNEL